MGTMNIITIKIICLVLGNAIGVGIIEVVIHWDDVISWIT